MFQTFFACSSVSHYEISEPEFYLMICKLLKISIIEVILSGSYFFFNLCLKLFFIFKLRTSTFGG
jgi:hypothetical protein